jgi:preprotein translocase subunit SecE
MKDDYMPMGNLFNAWNITGTPQEEIEFSRDEPNTPTLNNGTVPEDSTTPEEPRFTTMEPLVPVLSEIVYRYRELTRGSRFQGRIQNTKNQILNTATQWASSLKARSEAQDRNTSTIRFPDSSEAEDTGGNPSPYEEPSPAMLILHLVDQALREVGMSYPLFMHAKIAVSKISALFQQFGMSPYEGVVKHSQSTHKMNMFYKRLWGEMRKYFVAPRQKKLNSIKQLIVYSIVIAVKCIGADGDIRNESGRGRLWKGTDEDRLFFHDAFLHKWESHMEKLGYPLSQGVLRNL